MELQVISPNLEPLTIVDSFESLIWAERFGKSGDFELYTPFDSSLWSAMTQDYFVSMSETDNFMIISHKEIITDDEDGIHMKITGKSLETILNRRIIWGRKVLTGDFQKGIRDLLNENAITPTDTDRVIQNLIFYSVDDDRILPLAVNAEFLGDNLYDAISELCANENLDFKIVPDSNGNLVFSLYMGTDRSYDQETNPFVIFSPEFDNLANSDYIESVVDYKNVAWVGGEGEGDAQVFVTVGSSVGMDRRELFVDAKDVTSAAEVSTDPPLTTEEYNAQLEHRGNSELLDYPSSTTITGEADTTTNYVYGYDFFLGDFVQLENEFGMKFTARVTEMIFSQDSSKNTAVPKFSVI